MVKLVKKMMMWTILLFLVMVSTSSYIFGVDALASPSSLSPREKAMDIATGNWKAQSMKAFITSGIATAMEELCGCANNDNDNKNGDNDKTSYKFVSCTDIATHAGLHPIATYRLLRYLSTFDVCIQQEKQDQDNDADDEDDKMFTLGPIGELLTPNHPQSVADFVVWETSFTSAKVWDQLDLFLKTNDMIASTIHNVNNMWDYFEQHPTILASFGKAMTSNTNVESYFLSTSELSPTLDNLNRFNLICDLGGSEGCLVKALATKRFPNTKFIVADLPSVIERIDSSTLPSNVSIQSVNFLTEIPPYADAYIMKHIIHDWKDDDCTIIFQNIVKANSKATIYIIEFGPMPGSNIPHVAKGFDIHMGIMNGAIERTQNEYNTLFKANGYELVDIHYLDQGKYPLYVQEIKLQNE